MKLAVMQPYFFPYLGYFQLVNAVDVFVFLDDVAFMKNSWINRNRLINSGYIKYFSVPLAKISSNVSIRDTRIYRPLYLDWKTTLFRTLWHSYRTAPHFASIMDLVQTALAPEPDDIATLAIRSVEQVSTYLGIDTEFKISSRDYRRMGARGVRRVLEICRRSQADVYINAPGGRGLYDRADFVRERVALAFLIPQLRPYPQAVADFAPGLSIIDVLMHCSRKRVRSMLEQCVIE